MKITTKYGANIAQAVDSLSDWDNVNVYSNSISAVCAVVAESGCEQHILVFVRDKLVHTTTDGFPAYFITPQMAVTEALEAVVAAQLST